MVTAFKTPEPAGNGRIYSQRDKGQKDTIRPDFLELHYQTGYVEITRRPPSGGDKADRLGKHRVMEIGYWDASLATHSKAGVHVEIVNGSRVGYHRRKAPSY